MGESARSGWAQRVLPLLGYAGLCYVPLLLTEPGAVVADTKAYLYLDPSRLLARAPSLWDPHVALGTITHQNIGYLWPMGPWFWATDRLGVPDWFAQRLWLGTILFLAGLGMRYLLRTFGWRGPSVGVAMVAYALSPYVLAVAARISVLLVAFAALPWLLALAVRSVRAGGWRHPALFALVAMTAGSVNATALLLVCIAPALWIVWAVIGSREARLRTAVGAGARIAVLSVAVSAWWIAGLSVQATNGLDVLRYSETAETAAQASVAQEVFRGLGNWFFYGEDRLGPWVEPSAAFTQRPWLLAVTFLVPILSLAGAALARWRQRAYFVGLVALGVLVAVGAHPFDDPPVAGRAIKALITTDVGLALRNLPRAVPLVALGSAVLLGSGVAAVLRRRPGVKWPMTVALLALVIAALPTLWQRGMVPDNLRRPEAIPAYWEEAGRYLDETDDGTRVLEIPGSDFASYRWGNTVEPITPGLTDRPVVARELIPYGSAPSADLLIAFDGRLQAHVAEPESFAPIARLMRAGQVLVRSDLQFERYNLARPRELWALVSAAPGLGAVESFGPAERNRPVDGVPLQDELELSLAPSLPDPPAVAVVDVEGSVPVVAGKPGAAPVVVSGDGAGLVDLAAAGLVHGDELVLYSASLDEGSLGQAMDAGAALVLTDTNRRQGERWYSVRYNRGYTEPAGFAPLVTDRSDNRLPVFPDAGDEAYTVALHRGGVTAAATSYGNRIEFTPEDRPPNAVDGDPTTAWRTGDFGPTIGERLEVTLDEPTTASEITLLQPKDVGVIRSITRVRLRFDSRADVEVDLGGESQIAPGQRVEFPERTFRRLDVEILDDSAGVRPRYGLLDSVGFAEVRIGGDTGPRLDEIVRLPTDLLAETGPASGSHPLAVVLTRLRSATTEVGRVDEEHSIVRAVELPEDRSFTLSGAARLSTQLTDDGIDRLVGSPGAGEPGGATVTSSRRMAGLPAFRGSAALDDDLSTAWSPGFGPQAGHWLDIATAQPVTLDQLTLTVLADGQHSVPTTLGVEVDGRRVDTLTVPTIADRSEPGAVTTVVLPLSRVVSGHRIRVVVDAVREVRTKNFYTRRDEAMPVGIAELGLAGVRVRPGGEGFDTGCRTDLLEVDGAPVPVAVRGSTAAALAGEPLEVALCGEELSLPAGESVLRATPGAATGIDLDRLVLRSGAGGGASTARGPIRDEAVAALGPASRVAASTTPRVDVTQESSDRLTVSVAGARVGDPFWLAFGQSHNRGWEASVDGVGLGEPVVVDGFANGWLVDPRQESFNIELEFAPQRRVWVALWISAAAALLCLVLAMTPLGGSRPASAVAGDVPRAFALEEVANYQGGVPSRRSAIAVALGLGVVAAAVVHPVAGAVLGAVGYVGMTVAGARRWVLLAAPGALAFAAAYVIALQVRDRIGPGFEWPAEFERAHPVAWMAVLFLLADVVIARAWRSAPPREVADAPATQPGPDPPQ